MNRIPVVLALALYVVVAVPATVRAQNQGRLSDLLPNLYLDAVSTEAEAIIVVFRLDANQTDAVINSARQRLAVIDQLVTLAGAQLTSFPVPSASAGFTYSLDASGTMTRASSSFGPIYAERPLTIGRKKLNIAANYQHVTFDHLEGKKLRGGEIAGYLGQKTSYGAIFFADSLDLNVTTDTTNVSATYGVTDRLDVGVAVPINRVSIAATLTSRVGDTVNGVQDEDPFVTSRSGSASGVGDIVIRAKYNLLNRRSVGLAEMVDVRLPTGDERNLLGVAGGQLKLAMIASTQAAMFSPHVNVGYTISGTSSAATDPFTVLIAPPEEINYAAGADVAVSLRTTVAFDAVGRTLRKAGTLTWGPSEFGAQFPQFQLNAGQNLNLLVGSVGVKVNPWSNMLLTTNVLFPLSSHGLTDKLTWMAGIDYSF